MQRQRREPSQKGRTTAGVDSGAGITDREIEDVEARSTPRTPVIYEIVSRLGEEEMSRPVTSLWWSGVAAGMSISFSLLAQALLQARLPGCALGVRSSAASAIRSVSSWWSCRASTLFTENTITAVLVMSRITVGKLWQLGRLWGVVLVANLVGTLIAAVFCTWNPAIGADLYEPMLTVSRHLLPQDWPAMFFGGITAGFLIAAMVWMIPSAETAQFYVVTLMTYLIAVGGFPHVVAGSVEGFMLVLHGDAGW